MSLSLLLSPVFLILSIYFLLKLNKKSPREVVSVGSMIDGLTEEQQKYAFDFLRDASKVFFNESTNSETDDVMKALELRRLKNKNLAVKDRNNGDTEKSYIEEGSNKED